MPEKKITNKDVYDSISKLYKIITGNGDPEKGILFKEAMVEKRLDDFCSKLSEISIKVDNNNKDFSSKFVDLEIKLNNYVSKLDDHISVIEHPGKELNWLDNIISSETRNSIIKWGIRFSIGYIAALLTWLVSHVKF